MSVRHVEFKVNSKRILKFPEKIFYLTATPTPTV